MKIILIVGGFDPNVCIADIKPRLFEYAEIIFLMHIFDNYSIITGVDGRGVNRGNVNIQHISI